MTLLPRAVIVLLFLVATLSVARAESFDAVPVYDRNLVGSVVGTGLAFMQPRTIEPVTLGQLSVWGLRSLTALDPRLQLTVDAQVMRLSVVTPNGVRQVWESGPSIVDPADATAWGGLVADGLLGGWNASNRVRHVGTEGVVRGFFDELFSHLDPYSRYAPPEEAAAARRERDGAGDLGLRIAARPNGLLIVGVEPDSVAARAGLRRGNWIVAIDDTPISAAADTATASGLLTGPDGSRVTLQVSPSITGAGRTLTLTRIGRVAPTVFSRRTGGVLVVRVSAFSRDTGARLAETLAHDLPAGRHPVRGVLIDLRGNRGGLLDQAVASAGALLDHGLVATTDGRDPASRHTLEISGGHDAAHGLPLVLLVDGRTASSAEVLAAALSDQRRGVVVGSATFGKGLVQTVAPLPDGGELYVSWSQIVAPAGWPLQGLGILPALCTSNGADAALAAVSELSRGVQPDAGALARHDAARLPLSADAALDIRATCPPADGGDADILAATKLIDDPHAYAAALKP